MAFDNNIKRGHFLRIAFGIIILALLFAESAGAATITVPDNSTKIQWAIDNATSGDTIEVHNGTYYENVNVTKQLILRGIGMPVVNAKGSGSAITLAADGIVLEGFIATGVGFDYDTEKSAGIKVISSNNKLIGNNANSNSNTGIYLVSSSNNLLSGNNANSNSCPAPGTLCSGITLSFSNNNTMIGNNANSNDAVKGWGKGITLSNSNNNNLSGNNATSNFATGIYLNNSENNTLISNNASWNFGFSCTCNSGTGPGIGIILDSSSNNTLAGNYVSNQEWRSNLGGKNVGGIGIRLDSSSNNKIYNNYFNNFFNNIFNINSMGSNVWNTTRIPGPNVVGGQYLGGNYWANPNGTGFSQTCTDVNGDGICDSPYVLDANNSDYLPLLQKPSIYFINPTPANGANVNENYVLLNTTAIDSSTAFIDWNRSLIGWWRFNNESGENLSFFRDWSSWGNNGACSGTGCPASTSGKFGNGLNFDGINDYVDAGSGESLDITDAITIEAWINPAVVAPTLKGSYHTNGEAGRIAVVGNYAYVVHGNGLVIVDVSNPVAPTLKGSYDTAGASEVALQGNYAYVANGDNGLVIVDVTNPALPTLKGSYDTAGSSSGVAVAGNYAYVADGYNGLVIVDVTNPALPTLKGSYDTAGSSSGVAVAGNYAYVADGDNGLVIVDVTNPALPTLKGSYDTAGSSSGVAVAGNYAYVACWYNGLVIVDVTNPALPTLKGSYDTAGSSSGVAVMGNYAYVAVGYYGLVIVDVSNPADPTLKGSYDTAGSFGSPYGLAVAGNYAYIANGIHGLEIVDVSNPALKKNALMEYRGTMG